MTTSYSTPINHSYIFIYSYQPIQKKGLQSIPS